MVYDLVKRFPFPELYEFFNGLYPVPERKKEEQIEYEVMKQAWEAQPKLLERIERQNHAIAIQEEKISRLEGQLAELLQKLEKMVGNNPELAEKFNIPLEMIN